MPEIENPSADIPDTVWNIQNSTVEPAFPEEYEFDADLSFDELADAIEQVTEIARNVAVQHIYSDQLWAYRNNGRMIVAYEQNGRDRAEYGDQTLTQLSKRLTSRLGRGFSRTNLYNMGLPFWPSFGL